MALQKSIDTSMGVPATYHRIIRVNFDVIARKVWFVLAGYASGEAREAGKDALMETPFTMLIADNTVPEDVGRTQMYAFAKATRTPDQAEEDAPKFADAVDA